MLQSDHAKGTNVAPTPENAGDLVSFRATIALTAAQLTAGKIIEMGPLPAGCDLVDAILDSDDLDTNGAPAVTIDAGVMSGAAGDPDAGDVRTIGAELFSGSTVAQAGGLVRPTLKTAVRIARSNVDRGIGVKIVVAPATPAAGTVGLTLIYKG